jgi:hypothetical protein
MDPWKTWVYGYNLVGFGYPEPSFCEMKKCRRRCNDFKEVGGFKLNPLKIKSSP